MTVMTPNSYAGIIGSCDIMQRLFSLIAKVTDTDTTILVHGESGTGKELIARAIHSQGARRNNPFVPINCGAIPAELLESELFGHEKGAFTHAIRTRQGRFELADSGTVFLDEISEMSPMLQVKLLRVLQERQFERVGGTQTIISDFRVIAATNRNLEEEVKIGRFREDLYYRLNVIPIQAPPLRDRSSDIVPLVEHFIHSFNESKNRRITGISQDALGSLLRYSWPGNVRELENIIERMVILAAGNEITSADLPEKILQAKGVCRQDVLEIPEMGFFLTQAVADYEKKLIVQALNQTDWVKNQAAQLMNVNRTTLIEKMKRYDLVKPLVTMTE
ncbi:MAG: sigma-54 dependent transcriptional regulator [Desulfobulbaceae bacterium]|nr:sigma-54 dependent transcriptional regulator [Desulfobulbaceae bacterium]